ncbi:MAG: dTMP kinase [Nitrospiria bacterium]
MGGYFITFEGGEGSGKSTQLARLADYLEGKGLSVVRTREPGGTRLADRIRGLILNPSVREAPMNPKTELFLYLASRAQHIAEVIRPALAAGKLVLCDRFTDATLAYQGAGRGLPKQAVGEMVRFASEGMDPDLTLLLQLDIKTALARLKGRGEINRLDEENFAFHEAVQDAYAALARAHPKRIVVIDADDSIEAVFAKIRERIDAFLS